MKYVFVPRKLLQKNIDQIVKYSAMLSCSGRLVVVWRSDSVGRSQLIQQSLGPPSDSPIARFDLYKNFNGGWLFVDLLTG